MPRFLCLLLTTASFLSAARSISAQDAPRRQGFGGPPPIEVTSPQVADDRQVTFRVLAPKAEAVLLASSDLPNIGRGVELKKNDDGVWEGTVGPVDAGAYRYTFNVDGVTILDPRNTSTSESNGNLWSVAYVPGSEQFDLKDVSHGAIAEVTYDSTTLKRPRRMHVYTPPGYEKADSPYPVLYLLHGAMDSDDSWSTVGCTGRILDNLIAEGKASPMIVVMPNGHTGPFRFGPPGENSFQKQMDEFVQDFQTDIRPYIEKTYSVNPAAGSRAIAGLSMGGAQTLNIAIPNLKDYGYVGVFSSGVFGIVPGPFTPPGPSWEEQNAATLDDSEAKKDLKLVWFATGKDDFLIETSRGTVNVLKKHGFDVTYEETAGGHTWLNWRDYLTKFAPLLFRD
jgi:enterochelin esterase family protein